MKPEKKIKVRLKKNVILSLTRRTVNDTIKAIRKHKLKPPRNIVELSKLMADPNISSEIKKLYFGEYCIRRAMKK